MNRAKTTVLTRLRGLGVRWRALRENFHTSRGILVCDRTTVNGLRRCERRLSTNERYFWNDKQFGASTARVLENITSRCN
ncbi:hypothetical protein RRG08_016684 [Elysia crispata]|uniref:Uncharacterized protein n=1 Tax=Elysia crispata TaxID=231223 RepID=A0AAE1AJK1_9GAST|nr:hypothetical protein RRG08_016684 [Elysia crispata]